MASRYLALLTLCAGAAAVVGPNATKTVHKTDTYLEAYSKSRIEAEKAKQGVVIVTAKDGEKKISNRDDSFSGYDYTPADSYSPSYSAPSASSYPSTSYGSPVKLGPDPGYSAPANTYGPPAQTYGPPANTYGPPANTYGPPANSYGPPAQTYGPPAPAYGPPKPFPPPAYGPPSYGTPYSTGIGFLDKLALKLDILTVAKLLLKLFIFKKIVTMLAVVCMLLVIPKLIEFKKDKNGNSNNGNNDNYNDEGDERTFGDGHVIKLTSAQQLLQRAIAVYSRQQPDCGVVCRVQRVLDDIYEFEPYARSDAS